MSSAATVQVVETPPERQGLVCAIQAGIKPLNGPTAVTTPEYLRASLREDFPDYEEKEVDAILSALEDKRQQLENQISAYIAGKQKRYDAYKQALCQSYRKSCHEGQRENGVDESPEGRARESKVNKTSKEASPLIERADVLPDGLTTEASPMSPKLHGVAGEGIRGTDGRSPARDRGVDLVGALIPKFLPLLNSKKQRRAGGTKSMPSLAPIIVDGSNGQDHQFVQGAKRTSSVPEGNTAQHRRSSLRPISSHLEQSQPQRRKKSVSLRIADTVVRPTDETIATTPSAPKHSVKEPVPLPDPVTASSSAGTSTAKADADSVAAPAIPPRVPTPHRSPSPPSPPPSPPFSASPSAITPTRKIPRREPSTSPTSPLRGSYGSYHPPDVTEQGATMAAADGLPVTSPVGGFRRVPARAAAFMCAAAVAEGEGKKAGVREGDETNGGGEEDGDGGDGEYQRRYGADEDEDEDEGVLGGMEDL